VFTIYWAMIRPHPPFYVHPLWVGPLYIALIYITPVSILIYQLYVYVSEKTPIPSELLQGPLVQQGQLAQQLQHQQQYSRNAVRGAVGLQHPLPPKVFAQQDGPGGLIEMRSFDSSGASSPHPQPRLPRPYLGAAASTELSPAAVSRSPSPPPVDAGKYPMQTKGPENTLSARHAVRHYGAHGSPQPHTQQPLHAAAAAATAAAGEYHNLGKAVGSAQAAPASGLGGCFPVYQVVVGVVLFVSELWVRHTNYAPMVASYMAFPFASAMAFAGLVGCSRTFREMLGNVDDIAGSTHGLYVVITVFSLLMMSGFGMGYWSSKYAYEHGGQGGVYATWIWISLSLLYVVWGTVHVYGVVRGQIKTCLAKGL